MYIMQMKAWKRTRLLKRLSIALVENLWCIQKNSTLNRGIISALAVTSDQSQKYKAEISLYKEYSVIKVNNENFEVPLVGLFNAYNALGAIALCKELGIENIIDTLPTFKVAFGRSEVKYLNGKHTLIQLIKNPLVQMRS